MFIYKLAELVPLPYSRGKSTHDFDGLLDFSVTIPKCYTHVYIKFLSSFQFFAFMFVLTYDLDSFKSRLYLHLSSKGSYQSFAIFLS